MADKAISELVSAEQITATDMFVLEQNGTAKKLTGQVLLNWLTAAADGHGGIQSYALLKTEGLVKTYRFTLADQSHMDIQVTDGRGISSITKTGTSGLVDTYRISCSDGTSDTFTVTNGAKGDTGDNSYIWIKYASQEPTASSHSFGDVPDAWIGVYFGTASSAPTNWQQYRWYKFKGEKGDTGDPATLVSVTVTYQAGTSGTVVPSGSWTSSVPQVTQGQYLWTRIVQQFNSGSPITAYSVSRMGMDGLGSVVSVAGIAPNENGDVPLNAAAIGALALTGGTMTGEMNMNGQKLTGLNDPTANSDAANKNYVDKAVKNVDVSAKVDKSSVVNNFTTTAAGYVADARALKTLSDSKMSKVLLWENASPDSDFLAQTISLNLSGYAEIHIVIGMSSNEKRNTYVCIVKVGENSIMGSIDCTSTEFGRWLSRKAIITETSITFDDSYRIIVNHGTFSIEQKNNYSIPLRIYGIKEVPA